MIRPAFALVGIELPVAVAEVARPLSGTSTISSPGKTGPMWLKRK